MTDARLASMPMASQAEDVSNSTMSSSSKREQKRRPKPRDGTVLFCGVCGDRALGYNFDAVSCESCKAFFRRNALKTKPFTCTFDGNCKLDAHTRKFCSGCRLKKCFDIGMKKEWILNNDQLSKRRKRQQMRKSTEDDGSDIYECTTTTDQFYSTSSSYSHPDSPHFGMEDHKSLNNHPYQLQKSYRSPNPQSQISSLYANCWRERANKNVCDSSSNSYFTSGTSSFNLPRSSVYLSGVNTAQLHHSKISHNRSPSSRDSLGSSNSPSPLPVSPCGMSSWSPPPSIGYSTISPNSPSMEPTVSTSEPLPKYIKSEAVTFESIPPEEEEALHKSLSSSSYPSSTDIVIKSEPLCNDDDYLMPLSPVIEKSLNDLSILYDEIFEAAYAIEQVPKFKDNPKNADELFNMTDMFIRRLIRFAKNLPEFKALSQAHQIILLKSGIMEMFLMRSAMSFDANSKGWKFKFKPEQPESNNVQEGKLGYKALNTLGSNMVQAHMQFVHDLQEVTNKDRKVLMLLIIIELMSPDRVPPESYSSVTKCRERHLGWLKAYLESVVPVVHASETYHSIMNKLSGVRQLAKDSNHLTAQLDLKNLAPLLVEVLNLK